MFLGLPDPVIIDFFDFFSSKIYVYIPSNSIKQNTFSLFDAALGWMYRYLWVLPVPVPSKLFFLNAFQHLFWLCDPNPDAAVFKAIP